jgi:hypothetical protein
MPPGIHALCTLLPHGLVLVTRLAMANVTLADVTKHKLDKHLSIGLGLLEMLLLQQPQLTEHQACEWGSSSPTGEVTTVTEVRSEELPCSSEAKLQNCQPTEW